MAYAWNCDQGLELNPRDAWSTHSLAHVLEMQGRQNEGISFLSSTVREWQSCGMLACHNYWHWAVYHIEKGEYQGALDIYDGEVGRRASSSGAMLDIVDACSMLYRLHMEGIDVGGRWHDIYEACRAHVDDRLLVFNDVHVLTSCLGDKQTQATDRLVDSLKAFVRTGHGTNHCVSQEVGLSLCEAFVACDSGDYATAVDLLYPLRYKVLKIGGSNAQRDFFSQFLIHAAMKSANSQHHKYARQLLLERKALKANAPLTDRLLTKAMALHD